MNFQSFLYILFLSVPLSSCTTFIGPGQAGVLWTASDGTRREIYTEGSHLVAPWNEMIVYDLRSKSHDELLNVIAVNGLAIKLDATVRYHLIPAEIVAVQQEIGGDYYKTILEPVVRSEARRVIGKYTPEEIYSTKRDVIEKETREGIQAKISGKHIALEAILVRNVELPEAIRTAIDKKLSAEQEVLKMKYIIEVARAVAEQRRIEADAIAAYNRIVSASLSPTILEYERIRELGLLSRSENSKTIVMGQGTLPAQVLINGAGGEKKK